MADFDNDDDNEAWDDWKDDENEVAPPSISLFEVKEFKTAEEAFSHMKENHGFDILALQTAHGLDQYGCIRLINYVRTLTKVDPEKMKATTSFTCTAEDFEDEKFFVPVLNDDTLLMHDFEPEGFDENTNTAQTEKEGPTIATLQEELRKIKEAFAIYREATERDVLGGLTAAELRSDGAAATKAKATKQKERKGAPADDDDDDDEGDIDEEMDSHMDAYFNSYSHFGIHEEMLKDRVRTESYRDSMYNNKSLFTDKVVLDVGCGTGILSMMAARAGAKKVIGIDNSSIITTTREIVKANGLSDVITLIRGKVEEIEDLTVDKVDIIISEWMGYFLFFESMLDTVLYARDKWLADGGVVLPDRCSLHIVAISDVERYQNRIGYWSDVYGFKMDPMRSKLFPEPDITVVDPASVVSAPFLLKDADVMKTTAKELSFNTKWTLKADKDATITALCVYFDTFFAFKCENPVIFSTGPKATPTHWKQTMFYLQHTNKVEAGAILEGTMFARPNTDYHRQWDVTITYVVGNITHTQNHRI